MALTRGSIWSGPSTFYFKSVNWWTYELEILKEQLLRTSNRGALPLATGRIARPKASPTGFAKIHVDAGVSNTNRRGSAAVVCRDQFGHYLGNSSLVVLGLRDAASMEAIACREGLSLVEDLGPRSFIITSDAKQVVSDIAKK